MGKTKCGKKNAGSVLMSGNRIIVLVCIFTVLIFSIIIAKLIGSGNKETASGDLIIPKSEIPGIVGFYPYKAGRINMEIIAVRASDGTIRTAFNTCQVCFDSGRGYYRQQGDSLVCQNCGNRFYADEVELVRGGCNPVPITDEYKTEDEEYIVISGEFIEAYRELFRNWKR